MKLGNLRIIVAALYMSIIVFGTMAGTNFVHANDYSGSQISEPFSEMLPGVYVAWEWWNESGYYDSNETVYVEPTEPYPGNNNQSYPDTNQTYPDPYAWYHTVADVYGNAYYIREKYDYHYVSDWSYCNLLVVILLDPDASYLSWLASNTANVTDDSANTVWSIFWWPEPEALSGDEVFLYSTFYFSDFNESGYHHSEYTWFDENMTEVNANDVIPILHENYSWAYYMNESYTYDYDWEYAGFGYDVNEMFLEGNQTLWMDHYYAGMTVFNDKNNNGIMDIAYDEVEYDWNNDSIVDWVSYEMNFTASEYVYDFYSSYGFVGDVTTPFINSNGEIQWSAEVVDIKGDLWSYSPIMYFETGRYSSTNFMELREPESIPVNVDKLEMIYRFGVTNNAAVLKIDQHIGDFRNPDTGEILEEVEGLSLAFNYFSWFSSYTLSGAINDGARLSTTVTETEASYDGVLQFSEAANVRTIIEFGGTYVWGNDGGIYDVGTAVMPSYFTRGCYDTVRATDQMASDAGICCFQTYQYSSCYSNWDGYSIIHDPIFSVFPMKPPGEVSVLIYGVIASTIAIGVIAVGVLGVVCLQINKVRRET